MIPPPPGSTLFPYTTLFRSLKDRGAILPVGHYGDAAYWMVDGNWVSSSFYMDELPNYVKKFNREDRTTHYLNQGWNTLYDLETYNSYVGDDNSYEEPYVRSEEHTSELQSRGHLVCRL